MAWNGRAKATRNMLTESFPKDVHSYRPNVIGSTVPVPDQKNTLKEAQSTEYRRVFGSEKKLDEGEGGGGPDLSLTLPLGRPSYRNTRCHPASTMHLLRPNPSKNDLKTDWTTSYMRDFKRPTTAIGLITGGDELPPPAQPEPVVELTTLPPCPEATPGTASTEATPQTPPFEVNIPSAEEVEVPIQPRNKNKVDACSGDSMKKLLRHTNFLPNPISEERRSFDDDESHNPTLKKYIEMISRK